MAHINLLPWREAQRQQQKQQYLLMLLGIGLIVGLIFWFVGEAVNTLINNQNTRNAFLQKEIAVLDLQIAEIQKIKQSKIALEQRMALIEQLQVSRNTSPIVFEELARILPPGLAFTSMRRTGNRIEIEGISDSNNRLADFMRAIELSDIFSGGEISSIVANSQSLSAVSDFSIQFDIAPHIAPTQVTSDGVN